MNESSDNKEGTNWLVLTYAESRRVEIEEGGGNLISMVAVEAAAPEATFVVADIILCWSISCVFSGSMSFGITTHSLLFCFDLENNMTLDDDIVFSQRCFTFLRITFLQTTDQSKAEQSLNLESSQ